MIYGPIHAFSPSSLKYCLPPIHIALKARSPLYHESSESFTALCWPHPAPRSPLSLLPSTLSLCYNVQPIPSCSVRLSISISTQIRCVPGLMPCPCPCVRVLRACSRTAEVSRRTLTNSPGACPRLAAVDDSTCARCKLPPFTPNGAGRQGKTGKAGKRADRQTGRIHATQHTHSRSHPHPHSLWQRNLPRLLYTRCSRSRQQLLITTPPRLSAATMRTLACHPRLGITYFLGSFPWLISLAS